MLPVRRALISVSDKTGLEELARGLTGLGIEILSTGGTARFLAERGVPVVKASEVTEHPEILDGRVKTLHPRIHGGILADRSRASHLTELKEYGITPIDLVAVNLYPFERALADPEASFDERVETIDIGGPTLVRAAAKNHHGVVVVVDPEDYPKVVEALADNELTVPPAARRRLAAKAFRHTQLYDAAIAGWLAAEAELEAETFPQHRTIELVRALVPRYGENPHQGAAIYRPRGEEIFGGFSQLQGKELSWNNLLDADAARRMVAPFEEPALAILKHNNPCGLARGKDLRTAYRRALATDPTSAFGSVVAVNRTADGALAEAMAKLFVEVILAPGFEPEAREVFGRKKNLRLLECPVFAPRPGQLDLRSVDGGFLAQETDAVADQPDAWTCPTRRKPKKAERAALELAWKVVRFVKSNAIVLCKKDRTIGIGAGQMSRVDSCHLALRKARGAGLDPRGTVAASDAFFPFPDGLEVLAEAGVTAVVQPGGSVRDAEVVEAADRSGLAMLLTGRRHFRH